MTRIFLLCLLVAGLLSCDKNQQEQTTFDLDEAFSLEVGQTKLCNCTAPAITLDGIVSDSRCPEGAMCVWEGEATVRLAIGDEWLQLSTHAFSGSAQQKDTLGGFVYTLVDVLPYPVIDQTIPQDDYEISLLVEAL